MYMWGVVNFLVCAWIIFFQKHDFHALLYQTFGQQSPPFGSYPISTSHWVYITEFLVRWGGWVFPKKVLTNQTSHQEIQISHFHVWCHNVHIHSSHPCDLYSWMWASVNLLVFDMSSYHFSLVGLLFNALATTWTSNTSSQPYSILTCVTIYRQELSNLIHWFNLCKFRVYSCKTLVG